MGDPVDGHVDWPSNKKTIPKNAFRNCKLLRTISIPPEVTSIHNTAFSKSGLDLSELLNCVVDPSPLLFLKGPRKIERSVAGEPAVVLADPPIDYVLKFDIKLKGNSDDFSSVILLTTDDGSSQSYGRSVPGIYVVNESYLSVEIDDDVGGIGLYPQSLELNKKSSVVIKVYGSTASISVNGVIGDTSFIRTRSQLSNVKFYIGDPSVEPANAIISNISFDKDVTPEPSLFDFKGPLQIERSEKGEPAAVLAAPPTDYTLKFVIEPKGIIDTWGSIIYLTTGDWYYPGYPYGTIVPAVFLENGTTRVCAYIGYDNYDQDGATALFSKPLEVDKKSKVVIEVYGTTAFISVNGVIEYETQIGTRSQLNDVKLYIGSPFESSANAIVSDISFG